MAYRSMPVRKTAMLLIPITVVYRAAFFKNGLIQVLGNTASNFGNANFHHAIVDLRKLDEKVCFKIIEVDILNFGFPNISYTGKVTY